MRLDLAGVECFGGATNQPDERIQLRTLCKPSIMTLEKSVFLQLDNNKDSKKDLHTVPEINL